MSFENKEKAWEAHVVSTTRSGMMGCMDCTIPNDDLHGKRCR